MRKTSIAVALAAIAVVLGGVSGTSPSAAGVAQAAPRSFFGIVPQAVISEEDAEYMRAARIGSIRLPIGWDSIQSSPRGPLGLVGHRPRNRHRGQPGPDRAAVPRRSAELGRAPGHAAADRQRPPAARLDALRPRGGRTLRPGRRLLARTPPRRARQGRHQAQPLEADPRLADLERGQLLLLRLPGLAGPLRPPAEDQLPGGQGGRPARPGDPLRAVRRTRPGRQVRHGRRRLPRTALPGARDQALLRRRRPPPVRLPRRATSNG